MKCRIKKLSYFSINLAIFGGLISSFLPTKVLSLTPTYSRINSPKIAQASSSDEAELIKAKEVTQGFFDSLIAGEFEKAREYFSPSIKEYFTAADLEKQWQKVLNDMGSFIKYKKIRPTKVFDTYYVLMTANFENLISDFSVTLDSNQQITTIDFLLIGNIQTNAEEFVDALSTGKYAIARGFLTPDLKEELLPEDLEQEWQEIVADAGAFKYRTNSKVVEGSRSDAVLINLEFAKEKRSFMIIFNPLGEIVGVDFPQSPE